MGLPLRKAQLNNRFPVLLLLPIILFLLLSQPAGAAVGALEITGEGVAAPVELTLAQLEAMEQYQHVYSAINTYPTKQWYIARGVKLRDLLTLAGMKKRPP